MFRFNLKTLLLIQLLVAVSLFNVTGVDWRPETGATGVFISTRYGWPADVFGVYWTEGRYVLLGCGDVEGEYFWGVQYSTKHGEFDTWGFDY